MKPNGAIAALSGTPGIVARRAQGNPSVAQRLAQRAQRIHRVPRPRAALLGHKALRWIAVDGAVRPMNQDLAERGKDITLWL